MKKLKGAGYDKEMAFPSIRYILHQSLMQAVQSEHLQDEQILPCSFYYIYRPPFTCTVVPVTYSACAEARKAAALATSAGDPRRPRGTWARMAAVCVSFRARVMSVSINPGDTQLTAIGRASCRERVCPYV